MSRGTPCKLLEIRDKNFRPGAARDPTQGLAAASRRAEFDPVRRMRMPCPRGGIETAALAPKAAVLDTRVSRHGRPGTMARTGRCRQLNVAR